MPPKKQFNSTETINALRGNVTPQQRLDYLEEQMTRFMQWHESLGDSVTLLHNNVGVLTGRVEVLENSFDSLRKEVGSLSAQLHTAASTSQELLRGINSHLVGSSYEGVKRPGLCDDVRDMNAELKSQGLLMQENASRLSSLERSRATMVWLAGTASTIISALTIWALSHSEQLLDTVNTIYGKPKTEVTAPVVGAGK